MNEGGVDLLEMEGLITAPAGCGKTHLIADAASRHARKPPLLVLTHTNAGVAALRDRLARAGAKPSSARIATVDGWSMNLIASFPGTSGHDAHLLEVKNPKTGYPAIREHAAQVVESGHADRIIQASYSRIIVDEYQDCSVQQHRLVTGLAGLVPTAVLGDPLQAIFGFGSDPLPDWQDDVCQAFRPAAQLDTPWRWINAGAKPLGEWLLKCREDLLGGTSVDLRNAPSGVSWIPLTGKNDHDHPRRLMAGNQEPPIADGRVLIIGDNMPNTHHAYASQIPGSHVVEAVDLKNLMEFANNFDPDAEDSIEELLQFASDLMTGTHPAERLKRLAVLESGTARKAANESETMGLAFRRAPTHGAAAALLEAIGRDEGVRIHRPVVVDAIRQALRMSHNSPHVSLAEAARQVREDLRARGRALPRRAVGSTLLLKGLEAEAAVILDGDGLSRENLYVAMTRGSMSLTVCSQSPLLG